MLKWMFGFMLAAIVAAAASFSFGIPAAGTVAIVCLVLAALLMAGRLFERTASA
jgi:hypothetical protein